MDEGVQADGMTDLERKGTPSAVSYSSKHAHSLAARVRFSRRYLLLAFPSEHLDRLCLTQSVFYGSPQ